MLRNRKRSTIGGWIGLLMVLLIGLAGLIVWLAVPLLAENHFGTASSVLTKSQRWSYSAQLLIHQKKLLTPNCISSKQIDFSIGEGDPINTIADHLESQGIINDAKAFRAYLIYSGLDTQIRAGEYQLACDHSSISVAQEIKNKYIMEVVFNILPGWRAEEIAAALPTSGIEVRPEEFMRVILNPNGIQVPEYIPQGTTLEGFLFPGEYLIKRTVTAQQLVQLFLDRFDAQISPEIPQKISDHGLTFYQGIILASIVQRETYADEERPIIASVFYNRLDAGMHLETDPTVQYALGFDSMYGWWKSPLSASDLEVQSAYNTYVIGGLPPAPIANPDMSSIQAVVNPESSTFLYFRARCDGSGYHVFARTFEEHVANACK